MSILHSSIRTALLVLGTAATIPAHAQNADNDVLRRTQMQLRQSEQERNSLRSEVARLQAHLDSQTAELERLRQKAAQVQTRQDSVAAELSAKSGRLNQTTQALKGAEQELETLRVQNARQAQAVQNVRTMLENAERIGAQRQELVELCRVRNQELYTVGSEILSMYQDEDFTSFATREPVLQLQQVKLQNLAQEFEDRLRKQRMYEDTLPPSVEKAMQEDLSNKSASGAGGSAP